MPDPLALAAEQMAPAPARTNFFDPAAGQTIISRYANTKRANEGLEALGKAASGYADSQMALENQQMRRDDQAIQRQGLEARLEDQRLQRETAERNRTVFDRETLKYDEEQQAKEGQGEFLTALAGLDPTDPEFQGKVSELIAGANDVIVKDSAAQAILQFKNRAWDNQNRRKEQELRPAVRLASLGLRPEEFVYDELTGDLDIVSSTVKAYEKKGSAKSAEEQTKDAEKASDPEVLKKAVAPMLLDLSAFPTAEMNLARQGFNKTDNKAPTEAIVRAEDFDKNRPLAELQAARAQPSADAYANMMDKYLSDNKLAALTEGQKAKRKALWNLANGKASAAPTPAATQAPATKVRRYNPATGKIE